MNENPPVIPFSKRAPDHAPQPVFIDVNADSQSITINASVKEVYARCAHFEDLPRFITSLRDVQKIDENNFSCTSVVNGQEVQSHVQIILRVPNRRLAWQAVSDNFRIGVAVFTPRLDGMTEVMIKIRSIVEPVILSGALRQYLQNFKSFVETHREAEIQMKAESNSQQIESPPNASAPVEPARPNESDLPEWTWFIENPPRLEPSRDEVAAAMASRLEPLDE